MNCDYYSHQLNHFPSFSSFISVAPHQSSLISDKDSHVAKQIHLFLECTRDSNGAAAAAGGGGERGPYRTMQAVSPFLCLPPSWNQQLPDEAVFRNDLIKGISWV